MKESQPVSPDSEDKPAIPTGKTHYVEIAATASSKVSHTVRHSALIAIFENGVWRPADKLSKRLRTFLARFTERRGIRPETKALAELFRTIKAAHPELTMALVAAKANEINPKLSKDSNENTVEHAYKAMGWEWSRGERSR